MGRNHAFSPKNADFLNENYDALHSCRSRMVHSLHYLPYTGSLFGIVGLAKARTL
jgi:hypothetical protein